jgi:spermidine/putrescine transport system permease protein
MTARAAGYLLALPSWAWLTGAFLAPLLVMLSLSLTTGDPATGYRFAWDVGNYAEAVTRHGDAVVRSLVFATAATAVCLVLAVPVAAHLAFSAGRWRALLLVAVVVPYLVSIVVRTQQWRIALADDGVLLGPPKSAGLLPEDAFLVGTPVAVVGGMAYTFFPFMLLPVYVALEQLDRGLLEAAADLYASPAAAVRHVVLPAAAPGIAGGCLLTFIPATADIVNAGVLGGPGTTTVGIAILTEYSVNLDYPVAAALAVSLMAVLLLGIAGYARVAGTRAALVPGVR